MKSHTAITVLTIAALIAIGIYAKIDVQWALVAIAGAHGGTAAFDGRNK